MMWILWEGNVRTLGLEQRVDVARRLGLNAMSLSPNTLANWEARGLSVDDIQEICGEVRMAHLDPLVQWTRGYRLEDLSTQLREFSTTSQDEFFECAERLGVESITLPAIVSEDRTSREELVEDFAATCDRALPLGIRCDLEFLPYWTGVPTLARALEIVRGAARSNGRVLFDVYHFVRGGGQPADLIEVDGGLLSAIQVNDGTAALDAGADPVDDMLNARRLPGEGSFSLGEILTNLRSIGAGEVVGVEVFNRELDLLRDGELVATLTSAIEYVNGYLGARDDV